MKLRKEAGIARSRAAVLVPPTRFSEMLPINDIKSRQLPDEPGLYVLSEKRRRKLYAGETHSLRRRLKRSHLNAWEEVGDSIFLQTLPMDSVTAKYLDWQCCLVKRFKRPRFNYCPVKRTAS